MRWMLPKRLWDRDRGPAEPTPEPEPRDDPRPTRAESEEQADHFGRIVADLTNAVMI